jgi:polar amino acid transport system substrate-binding protein
MGLTIEFVIIEWGRADTATDSETMDAVISLEYTPERAKNLNLTRTYLESEIVILSRDDEPYDSLDELSEKTVGVCDSAYLNALTADSGAKIKNYSSTVNAYQQLRAKRADAIIADSIFVDYQKNGYAD